MQDKRTALLASFLPTLKLKRKQEQALAAITSAAGTDPSFATALLQDPTILHADADVTQPAITDLMAIENQGLSAQFFLGNDLASPPDQVIDSVPALSYAQTATIGGTITNGDVLTTTINGIPIPYWQVPLRRQTLLSDQPIPLLPRWPVTSRPPSTRPRPPIRSTASVLSRQPGQHREPSSRSPAAAPPGRTASSPWPPRSRPGRRSSTPPGASSRRAREAAPSPRSGAAT